MASMLTYRVIEGSSSTVCAPPQAVSGFDVVWCSSDSMSGLVDVKIRLHLYKASGMPSPFVVWSACGVHRNSGSERMATVQLESLIREWSAAASAPWRP